MVVLVVSLVVVVFVVVVVVVVGGPRPNFLKYCRGPVGDWKGQLQLSETPGCWHSFTFFSDW